MRSCIASGLEHVGMGIFISCKLISPERTDEWFLPAKINHSPTRLTFNHLPVPFVEAVGDISTSMPTFINERIDVWRNSTLFLPTQLIRPRWPPYFKTKGGCWECAHWLHRFTRPRAHAVSTPARDWIRGSVDGGLLTGFALKVVHFCLSPLLNRPSRAIRKFQSKNPIITHSPPTPPQTPWNLHCAVFPDERRFRSRVREDSWSCGNTNYDFDKEAIIYFWQIFVWAIKKSLIYQGKEKMDGKNWDQKNEARTNLENFHNGTSFSIAASTSILSLCNMGTGSHWLREQLRRSESAQLKRGQWTARHRSTASSWRGDYFPFTIFTKE